jgi:16S rRNA G966 N2-methylase RsmD
VRRQEVFEFLRRSSGLERFQIIFADPPYEKTKSGERFTKKLLTNKELAQLLELDGVFVLEKRPAEQTPATKVWDIVQARKYGATEVLFLRRPPSASMT